jgi:hypothetical protein
VIAPAFTASSYSEHDYKKRSAESWMAMQANHTLARYQAELEQWTPTKQVTAEGLVAVKGGKSKARHNTAAG